MPPIAHGIHVTAGGPWRREKAALVNAQQPVPGLVECLPSKAALPLGSTGTGRGHHKEMAKALKIS